MKKDDEKYTEEEARKIHFIIAANLRGLFSVYQKYLEGTERDPLAHVPFLDSISNALWLLAVGLDKRREIFASEFQRAETLEPFPGPDVFASPMAEDVEGWKKIVF